MAGANELLDIVVASALQLVGVPHGGGIIDAIDADQRFYARLDRGEWVLRIAAGECLAAERGKRSEVGACGSAEQSDARGIDAKGARLAGHELHAGQQILNGLRKGAGLGREPIGNGEHRDAARGKIRAPILKCAAHARDPAAAVNRDQRRRRFCAFRQIKIA